MPEIPVPFSGGCACGAIRYTSTEAPRAMTACHCCDCQQATGSAFFPGVRLRQEAFTLDRGEPAWFERTSDRGNLLSRAFCRDCGSPVFLKNAASPGFLSLYAGSLDDPSWFAPERQIFMKSAQPWARLDPDLPKFEAMPEPRT